MAVSSCFFDTSVLLPGLIDAGSTNKNASRIFDAIAANQIRAPKTAWHCCLEFFAVCTRLPGPLRINPSDALQLIKAEIFERFDVYDLPKTSRLGFLHFAEVEQISGARIYDAHIAEIAREAGADLVITDNARHFSSLLRHKIGVLTSEEFAKTLDT